MEENRFRIEITPLAKELQTPAPPGGVLTTSSGNYEAIFKGSGLEFRDFRIYTQTDSARKIDWKASLKTNKLLIREYQEERNAEVLFCYDVSSGMIFGSDKLKAHYGAEFIVSLGKHIVEASDAVGLVTFNDKITNFLPPELGDQQIAIITDILSSFSSYGGNYDFKTILDFLQSRILEGTTIILISDFFNFKKFNKYEKQLRILRAKFELIFVILRDPIEEYLKPKQKQILLLDPRTNTSLLITPSKIRRKYVLETQKAKLKLKDYLKNLNVPILELYTDRSFVEPLYRFFEELNYNR